MKPPLFTSRFCKLLVFFIAFSWKIAHFLGTCWSWDSVRTLWRPVIPSRQSAISQRITFYRPSLGFCDISRPVGSSRAIVGGVLAVKHVQNRCQSMLFREISLIGCLAKQISAREEKQKKEGSVFSLVPSPFFIDIPWESGQFSCVSWWD